MNITLQLLKLTKSEEKQHQKTTENGIIMISTRLTNEDLGLNKQELHNDMLGLGWETNSYFYPCFTVFFQVLVNHTKEKFHVVPPMLTAQVGDKEDADTSLLLTTQKV